jgi:5-methylthioadenosine/S-adenosylhomocysteine deaminase
MASTWIKNASCVVAWDADTQGHVYMHDADVVFSGNEITFVGKGYDGTADTVMDGRGRMILPGLITVHSHATHITKGKGLNEEVDSKLMFNTTLFEINPVLALEREYFTASFECAVSELLLSGCTTVVEMTGPYPEWVDNMARSGIRGYIAPHFSSSSYYTPNGHSMCYTWDEAKGRKQFEAALKLVDEVEKHPSGRLKGMVYPAQADSCTEDLMRDAAAAARERGMPLQTHCSQSVVEFREMMHRHGKTPVEWLHSVGFLGPDVLLGHVLFPDEAPKLHWPNRNDLAILAETGATVAHCPVIQARRGRLLRSFASYREKGVKVAIGTDAFPHNMIDEVRWATILCKIAQEDTHCITAADTFHAATVVAAEALGRDDLGRLGAGCKADLMIVDLEHPLMQPAHDPLRSLIFSALDAPIQEVYVDGRLVVKDHEVLTMDHRAAGIRLNEGQKRMVERMPQNDWGGRTCDEIFPLCLPIKE